jgi:hypothetical protein
MLRGSEGNEMNSRQNRSSSPAEILAFSDLAPVVAFYGMFRNVLMMRNMNNINHNGRYKTSLSIVSWTWRGNNIG